MNLDWYGFCDWNPSAVTHTRPGRAAATFPMGLDTHDTSQQRKEKGKKGYYDGPRTRAGRRIGPRSTTPKRKALPSLTQRGQAPDQESRGSAELKHGTGMFATLTLPTFRVPHCSVHARGGHLSINLLSKNQNSLLARVRLRMSDRSQRGYVQPPT